MLSFIRSLACFSSDSREYNLLETFEQGVWPTVSLPRKLGPITLLPPELVHLIIGHHVDPTTLASCSLVCTEWMLHARPRMFSRISISLSNADRFGRLFVPPRGVTFASHVREIELDHKIAGDFWTSDVLPKFVVKFPHLHTLSLFGLVPKSLPSAFQVVTHLELNYVYTPHAERLASVISAFPRLETLKVTQERGPSYFRFGDILSELHPPSPHLRRVDLDNPAILHWIASASPKPRLESICLEISQPEIAIAVESIRALSPSLRALDLSFSDLEAGGTYPPLLPTLPHTHF